MTSVKSCPRPFFAWVYIALAVSLCGLVCAQAAVAAPAGGGVTVQPLDSSAAQGYFRFRSRPGGQLTGRVLVSNAGSRPATARLYAVDATTGPTTGAAYLDARAARRGVGRWTRVTPGRVRLAPGEQRVVAFRLRVPERVRGGDHLGGIVADPGLRRGRSAKRGKSSFRIDVRTLTVLAIQVRLPKPGTPSMAIDSLRAGGMRRYQQLIVGLRNPGNLLVKGRGSVTVSALDGRPLKRTDFLLDTFVPRTRVDYGTFVRGKALPKGTYRATVTLRFERRVVRRTFTFKVTAANQEQVFGAAPQDAPGAEQGLLMWLIAAGAALLVALLLVFALRSRRQTAKLRAELRDRELRDLELRELDLWAPRVPDENRPHEVATGDEPHTTVHSDGD